MGRSAELEGFGEETEFLFRFLGIQPQDSEYPFLQVRVMNTDGTRGQLIPIKDQIVEVPLYRAGVLFQDFVILVLGIGKHVMSRFPAVFRLVEFKEGKVQDPHKGKAPRVKKPQIPAQLGPHRAQGDVGGLSPGICRDEDEVSRFGAQALGDGPGLSGKKLRHPSFQDRLGFSPGNLHPGEPFGLVALGMGFKLLDLLPGIGGFTRYHQGLDSAPGLGDPPGCGLVLIRFSFCQGVFEGLKPSLPYIGTCPLSLPA